MPLPPQCSDGASSYTLLLIDVSWTQTMEKKELFIHFKVMFKEDFLSRKKEPFQVCYFVTKDS